jgi:hypothetical protein
VKLAHQTLKILSRILEPNFSIYKLLTEQRESGIRLTQNAKRDPITKRSRTQPSANKQQDKGGKKEHTHTKQNKTKQNKAVEIQAKNKNPNPNPKQTQIKLPELLRSSKTNLHKKNQPESINRHIPTFC